VEVKWRKKATADLESIRKRINSKNPQAAKETAARLMETIRLLQTQPGMGREGRVPRTREWVAVKPYVIVYAVEKGVLVIVRVLHGAQEWPEAKKKD
jgi:addiction module RelE/StbE family toxin